MRPLYKNPKPFHNNDPSRVAGRVREKYSNGDKVIPLTMEPIGLNRIKSPVFFFENQNRNPVTNSFAIELDAIISEIEQIKV